MGRAYVGTSGWSYAHWKDTFYPPGLKQRDWLAYISERFETVEVNASFYRVPQRASVERWSSLVPEGFLFAVKLWQGFTHRRRLQAEEGQLDWFFSSIEPIRPEQRAPLLVQVPPQMKVDAQRLDRFLGLVEGRGWPLCVEFRNGSWLEPGIVRILDRHEAALCLHDMKWAAPVSEPNDGAPFVYVRRHGPSGRYKGGYGAAHTAKDAKDVRRWAKGRDVYVYFNNDLEGHALRNAESLAKALRVRRSVRPARPPPGKGVSKRPRPRARRKPLSAQR